jgi:hypothetical protein
MQDNAAIQWDPIYEGHLDWSSRLFIIYLFAVLLLSCFRAVRMFWHLRNLRAAAQESNAFRLAWDVAQARMASTKNWSVLTFVLSFLVAAWNMTRVLRGISMEKVTGTAFFAGATAEVLTGFCVGMLVCAVLYALSFFYETLLLRHKLRQLRRI